MKSVNPVVNVRYPANRSANIGLHVLQCDTLDMSDLLTSISLIMVPGASRTIKPTNMPANIDTIVSLTIRIRFIWR